MKKRVLNICAHSALVCLETLAVVAGLVFLVIGFIIWRLLTGPVDISFAKGYIEQALYDPVSGYSVSLEQVVIEWPDLNGPITLDLADANLVKNNNAVLEIADVSLGLSARHLLIGQIEPVSIFLDQPALNLIRTAANTVRLSLDDGGDQPAAMGPHRERTNPLANAIDMLSRPEGYDGPSSPFDNLQTVEIRQAQMVVIDYKLGITWYLSPLDLTFARDDGALMVAANVGFPGGRDQAARLQLDLVHRHGTDRLQANIHVQDFDPHILSRKVEELAFMNDHYLILNGNIELDFDKTFGIHKAALSLSSVNGEIMLDGVYDKSLPFEQLLIDAAYDAQAGTATLSDLSLTARGVTFNVASNATISEQTVSAPVTITIPDLPQDHIAPLWPDVLRGEGAEEWLTEKLSNGRFYDTVARFTVQADQNEDIWAIDIRDITADFGVETMDINYRAPLWPVTKASGIGRFENDELVIKINSGALRDLAVSQGQVKIDKLMADGGSAYVDVALTGPLQSVFHYIEPEPIGMTEDKLDLDVDNVAGQAALDISVSFPTKKDLLADQVKVKVDGTLNEVRLPDIVKTLDLTGGPFAINVADGAASLSGQGRLDGRAIEFEWREYIDPDGKDYASRVKAAILADKGLRDILGIGLDDWIDGSFPVDVTYTQYQGGRAEAAVSADLTPGRLMVDPLDYVKSAGTRGKATCTVLFEGGKVREVRDLDVETPQLELDNGRFIFAVEDGESVLRRGNLPRLIVEENDLAVDLEIGRSDLLKLSVTGAFLDARPFLGDNNEDEDREAPYDGPPLIASVTVDRMRTHPARMVDNAKLYVDLDRTGHVRQFEMDARAGQGDVYVRLKPDERGIMTIRLEADDAGATLRSFGVYENIRGGKLVLYGEAKDPQSNKILFGNVELTDFNVVNAPVLAQLLNAISLFGIQQLLGGEGIYFSRLESEFEWQIDRRGDSYFFEEGRTSGSSLGLTFKGRIVKREDLIRVEGTIVPVSMINEIISGIPLIGDILTGGGGGVIAATYRVEGPIKTPQVTVNPLSALAPGILRTILFE